MSWLARFNAFMQRVHFMPRARREQKKWLRMPVGRAPHPSTLDQLGQSRLQTHVRTRPDLY